QAALHPLLPLPRGEGFHAAAQPRDPAEQRAEDEHREHGRDQQHADRGVDPRTASAFDVASAAALSAATRARASSSQGLAASAGGPLRASISVTAAAR